MNQHSYSQHCNFVLSLAIICLLSRSTLADEAQADVRYSSAMAEVLASERASEIGKVIEASPIWREVTKRGLDDDGWTPTLIVRMTRDVELDAIQFRGKVATVRMQFILLDGMSTGPLVIVPLSRAVEVPEMVKSKELANATDAMVPDLLKAGVKAAGLLASLRDNQARRPAFEHCVEALADDHPVVQYAAMMTLAKAGAPDLTWVDAERPLKTDWPMEDLMRRRFVREFDKLDSPRARAAGMRALGLFDSSNKEILTIITQGIRDKDEDVARASVQSLLRLQRSHADAIKAFLADLAENDKAAADAINAAVKAYTTELYLPWFEGEPTAVRALDVHAQKELVVLKSKTSRPNQMRRAEEEAHVRITPMLFGDRGQMVGHHPRSLGGGEAGSRGLTGSFSAQLSINGENPDIVLVGLLVTGRCCYQWR